MNPFEMQAEFARQWLGLVNSATTAVAEACFAIGRQSAEMWDRNGASGMGLAGPSLPMPAWPNPFQPSLFGASNPFAAFSPWTALQMTMPPSASPFSAFAPWAAPYTPFAAFPFTATPWQFAAFPAATLPWSWPSPWSMAAGAMPGWGAAPPSAADVIDQVATAYRSASGHAIAVVLGPLRAPLDSRPHDEPWWQPIARHSPY